MYSNIFHRLFTVHSAQLMKWEYRRFVISDHLYTYNERFASLKFRFIEAKRNCLLDILKQITFFKRTSILSFPVSFKQFFRKEITYSLKNNSIQVVRVCARQCEFVFAHRLRRSHQIFCLYSKLWGESAFKELFSRFRQQLTQNGKKFILGATGISFFNWNEERISDSEIYGYKNEFQIVDKISEETVICPLCHNRLLFYQEVKNVTYCKCENANLAKKRQYESYQWVPFIERENMLIWRKEHQYFPGMYAYKVFGKYDDVTANDFLCVQIDTEFRKQWDHTAVNLQVVDSEPSTNSEVVYWEMEWPSLFANRDYVFKRRYIIDKKEKMIIVICKGTEHPSCPVKRKTHRVKEYWSIMVIKPLNNFSDPGIEFSLTYFDNPGISIPSSVASWVAMSGLPDFMDRLRKASIEFRECSRRKFGTNFKRLNLDEEYSSKTDAPNDSSTPQPFPGSNMNNAAGFMFQNYRLSQLFV